MSVYEKSGRCPQYGFYIYDSTKPCTLAPSHETSPPLSKVPLPLSKPAQLPCQLPLGLRLTFGFWEFVRVQGKAIVVWGWECYSL